MSKQLPKAYGPGGADLGRPCDTDYQGSFNGKVHLERVDIDSGGYDNGGAYWGAGQPLYHAWGDASDLEEEIEMFTRATDREDAKCIVLNCWPQAKFYR